MEIYDPPGDSIAEASHGTMKRICAKLSGVDEGARVLDIGSGYAGTARHLARTYGCHVTGLSISEVENERRRRMNGEQGLDHLIAVVDGTFEDIPFEDQSFEVVMVPGRHAAQRQSRQAAGRGSSRAAGGDLIFTDLMQADVCPEGVLQPILERLLLEDLASFARYPGVPQGGLLV